MDNSHICNLSIGGHCIEVWLVSKSTLPLTHNIRTNTSNPAAGGGCHAKTQTIVDMGRGSGVESESERCQVSIIEHFEIFKMAFKKTSMDSLAPNDCVSENFYLTFKCNISFF